MYYLSYCPYQKEYHIESEREFWETTFGVFKRSKFNGCAYVPIKQFPDYESCAKYFSQLLRAES